MKLEMRMTDKYDRQDDPHVHLTKTEKNYSTIEHEGLAMVYALQKYRNYLLGGHFKMYTNPSALKYLVNKPMLGGRICRWLLLFQEYDFEVIVNPRQLNAGLGHLSRIETGEEPTNFEEISPDTQLFRIYWLGPYVIKEITDEGVI